jgi:hypothetical protein
MADPTDPKNPLEASSLEERRASLSEILKTAQEAGESTEQLRTLMEDLYKIINNTNRSWEEWTGNLDEIKERMSEIARTGIDINNINDDQAEALEIVALYNSVVEESGIRQLAIEAEIERKLREKLGLSQRLVNTSKLFTSYEIQRLKASSDLLGPMGKGFNLLEGMRLKQAEIVKDLEGNITKEQALIILRAKGVQMVTGAATSLYGAFMANVKALSQMRAELNKISTGITDLSVVALEASEALGGVSMAEVGNTVKELTTGMSQFIDLTQQEQIELTKVVNTLERLGVSVSNQIQMFEVLTKGLGLTNQQGQEALRSLESFSKRANIPMVTLDKNIAAIGTKLAAFGKEGYQKAFESLSIASKNLAIDIGKLVQVTEQLTTFEGASKMAGELNAVLGKNLVSSMGLLNAAMTNPIEVFEQLKTAMDASGKSFDELGPAMQRHIASIFGMEATEAQRLFNMSLGEATSEMEHNAKTQQELAELAAKSADAFKRLEIAFQKIMSSPLVQFLITIIEGFAYLFEAATNSNNIFGILASGVFQLATFFVFAVVAVAKLRTAYTTFSTLLAIARGKEVVQGTLASRTLDADTAARWRNIEAIKAQQLALAPGKPLPIPPPAAGPSTLAFAKSLGVLAVAIIAVGAAMAIASLGFVPLVEAFTKSGAGAQYARDSIIALTVGIVAASIVLALASEVLAAAGAGLIAFGAGILLVGGAIALVAFAIAERTKQENELLKTKASLLGQLNSIELNASKLDSFASGLVKIADALKGLPDDKLEYLKELSNLASVSADISAGLTLATSSVTGTPLEFNSEIKEIMTEISATQKEIVETIRVEKETRIIDKTVPVTNTQPQTIQLRLEGPVNIDGAELGTLIYNGAAYYMEQRQEEKTAMSPSTRELKTFNPR